MIKRQMSLMQTQQIHLKFDELARKIFVLDQGCKFTLSPSPMGGVKIFHPSFTLG
jgi:hypothetical protein